MLKKILIGSVATVVGVSLLAATLGSGSTADTQAQAPAPTQTPASKQLAVRAVLAQPGLCDKLTTGVMLSNGEVAQANAIDDACAAVDVYKKYGRWPTGYAP